MAVRAAPIEEIELVVDWIVYRDLPVQCVA